MFVFSSVGHTDEAPLKVSVWRNKHSASKCKCFVLKNIFTGHDVFMIFLFINLSVTPKKRKFWFPRCLIVTMGISHPYHLTRKIVSPIIKALALGLKCQQPYQHSQNETGH